MHFRLFGTDIRFHPLFFFVIFLFYTLDKAVLAYYFVLPVVIHEWGHLLVMVLLRVRVSEIAFTPVSLRITRERGRLLSYGSEALISLGGPLANLLTALCLYLFSFASMRTMLLVAVNIAVGAFNLLPVGDLDGGRIVRQLCSRFFSLQTADTISLIVSFLALTPLFAASILLLLRPDRNFTLLLACIYLACMLVFRSGGEDLAGFRAKRRQPTLL